MKSVAVLLTVYNRKETTVKGITSLFLALKNCPQFLFDVFMTDDASEDDTVNTVNTLYPNVNILNGTGTLYWGGGMNLAWSEAVKKDSYDFYIWFNDDCILFPNAIKVLFDTFNNNPNDVIVVGAFWDSLKKEITYGGKMKEKGEFIKPNNSFLQEIKFINGNLVLISKKIFESVGFIDKHFLHAIGDYDYGLRANSKGFKSILSPIPLGICNRHDNVLFKSFNIDIPITKRVKLLYSPIGPNPIARFIYFNRYYGLFYALKVFLYLHFRTIFPYKK